MRNIKLKPIICAIVRTAILAVGKFKLTFIGCSTSKCSAFYLYRAASAGLSNNPLL